MLKKFFLKKEYKNLELNPEDVFYESLNRSNLNNDKMEGTFEKLIDSKVYLFLFFIFVAIFFIFIYKLFELQVIEGKDWLIKSNNNFIKEYPLFVMRGAIKDRNDILLSWNSENKKDNNISTLYQNNVNNIKTINNFSDILKSDNEIIKRQYIDVKDGFSNVLGYYSYPKKDNKGLYWKDSGHGIGGVEGFYDSVLNGVNGKIMLRHDVKGNIIDNGYKIDYGFDGSDINLTLDYNIQKIFYEHISKNVDDLNFRGGSGMLVNLNTGEILSMATYPSFDNNIWANRKDYKNATDIINQDLKNPRSPLLERNTQAFFVPGSIVKPFVAYAVLNEGVIDKFQNIYSSGKIVIKNIYGGEDTVFRDWILDGHGYVDLKKALAVSSDEYFYQTVGGYENQKGIGIDKLEHYMKSFFFATTTQIDFPKEVSGQIPSKDLKMKLTNQDWKLGHTYHASIGQDDWKVTPIEVLRSISFIAMDGESNQLHLVKSFNDPKLDDEYKKNLKNKQIKINLNQKHLDSVKEGMALATESIGTAHWYKSLPFKVYAKTGTAQLGAKNEFVNSWTLGYWKSQTNQHYAFILLLDKGPENNKIGASKIMSSIFEDILYQEIIDFNFDIK